MPSLLVGLFLLNLCMGNKLIVLVGPTGVGKTAAAIAVAKRLGCSVVSADSRQMFREMTIGTAVPSAEEMAGVPHYFIQDRSVADYYSAGKYELDALALLDELFKQSSVQVLTGGSMMYVDAVLKGFDDIPRISPETRQRVLDMLDEGGLDAVVDELRRLDPDSLERIDLKNRQRVVHALEVTLQGNVPYSKLLGKKVAERNFDFIKIGLNLPRDILYQRINDRVDVMMSAGLLDEARSLLPMRQLNALNTVGYKELFNYFDGLWTLDFAVGMIKQDSRRYAKRQLTWFKSDESVEWFAPDDLDGILSCVDKFIKKN